MDKMAWLQHLAVNQIALQSLHDYLELLKTQTEKRVFYQPCTPTELPMLIAAARGRVEAFDEIIQFTRNNMHRVNPTDDRREVSNGLPVVP